MDRETAALVLREREEEKQNNLLKLRDEIAMRAMQSILSNTRGSIDGDDISILCYRMADAMLAAREGK